MILMMLCVRVDVIRNVYGKGGVGWFGVVIVKQVAPKYKLLI